MDRPSRAWRPGLHAMPPGSWASPSRIRSISLAGHSIGTGEDTHADGRRRHARTDHAGHLRRLEASREDAAWIASLLVRANLRGHDSHGVIRIPQYVHALKTGDVNPTPSIKTEMETPDDRAPRRRQAASVRSSRGAASPLAIEKARAQGLSAVTLRRTNHVGRLADYAEMAAVQGLIGMLWVNAPTALNVAPWGGAARRLGTNPHAIAVPGPNATVAMSHDFATSVCRRGQAAREVQPRREGAARHHAQRPRRALDRSARVLHRPAGLADHRRRAQGLRPLARGRDPRRHPLRYRPGAAGQGPGAATAR